MKAGSARWLPNGKAGITAWHRQIGRAQHSVVFQTYIFRDDATGVALRDALVDAANRGVRVRLLVDAFGGLSLPGDFFHPLERAGGQWRSFNPLSLKRLSYRNHRKLLVADRRWAVLGGFNVGDEYAGDGVASGWCDLGVVLDGEPASELAASFDRLFLMAADRPDRLARLRRARERQSSGPASARLLLSGPGLGHNPLKAALMNDLGRANDEVCLVSPYFLPTWAIRRRLIKLARRGVTVRLLLPGRSDVGFAKLASEALYRKLLLAGVRILEYQPQILHAKLWLLGSAVYVGSANLNTRSLGIDYELMLRLTDPRAVCEARGLFDAMAEQAREIEWPVWRQQQSWWARLRQRLAYWLMARVDPMIAGWLWRRAD